MIAAIFSQSTLLVHCNLWILLIISAVMDVYRNFPDFIPRIIFAQNYNCMARLENRKKQNLIAKMLLVCIDV